MSRKIWVCNPPKQKISVSRLYKERAEYLCGQFLKEYLRPCLTRPFSVKNKNNPQCVDFSWQWRGSFIYFQVIYKDLRPNVLKEEFIEPFARLEFAGKDLYHLAYFRHTGQWHTITVRKGNTLPECFDIIRKLPIFQI